MDSVLDAARAPWVSIAPEIAGGLVYLDAGAAEAVQMSTGTHMLFGKWIQIAGTANTSWSREELQV
jgi:hypothetical protein